MTIYSIKNGVVTLLGNSNKTATARAKKTLKRRVKPAPIKGEIK